MKSRLDAKRPYIAELLRQMAAMEGGRAELQPLAYRALAKRLRVATGQFAPQLLAGSFGPHDALLAEVLENRHFELHGRLAGIGAGACRAQAAALLVALGVGGVAADDLDPGDDDEA